MDESQRHPSRDLVGDTGGGSVNGTGGTGSSGGTEAPDELQPLSLSSARITLWGTVGWLLALVVILAVPSLHQGDRYWWPWTCVAAIVIGLLGFSYVRRGRGNAAGAE